MKELTKHLGVIDNRIRVKQEDRQPYTEMFDEVRTWLVREMRIVSPVFDKIFEGPILFGSYPNRVRLDTPKEFDVLLGLKFPFTLELSRDDNRPGFIHLKMDGSVDTKSIDPDVYKELMNLVDHPRGKLKRFKLQWWIHNIITEVLKSYNPPARYEILYNKHAVAHNIYVKERNNPHREFGFDLVPAISIGRAGWMHIRNYTPFKLEYFDNFFAIPKKGGKLPVNSGKFTFMMVNPMAERELLWDKHNLKVVYRLIKSLKDHYKLERLKSAFITHTFLWEVNRCKQQFWDQQVAEIFLYMLEKLWQNLNDNNMNYFWVEDMNMLDILKKEEIKQYAEKLLDALKSLKLLASKGQLTWNEVAEHFDIPDKN